MRSPILFLILLSLGAARCGGSAADMRGAPEPEITPVALPLDGLDELIPGSLLTRGETCSFQQMFVSWFARRYVFGSQISETSCRDAKSQAPAFPDEFKDLEGRCTSEVCTVYTFKLTQGSRSQKFMGLVLGSAEQPMGLMVPLQPHSFTVYSLAKPVAASYYEANERKAFASPLPLISLTFSEAVKKYGM